ATGSSFTPSLRDTLTGRTGRVSKVTCSVLDGAPVAVAITDDRSGNAVEVWDLATGAPLANRTIPRCRALSTLPDGTPVAVTMGYDKVVQVWNLVTGAPIGKPFASHTDGLFDAACTSVDGTPVAVTGGFDKTVRVWNLATCEPIGEPLTGHNDTVVDVACSVLDGTPVAVSGSSDGTVRVWNLTAGTPLGKPRPGHTGQVTSAAYTVVHGTPAAATAGEDGTVRLWNIATGTPLGNPLPSHTATVYDGTPAAITTGVDDGQRRSAARVWDLAAGIPLVPHWTPIDGARAVAWMNGIPVAMSDSVLSGDVRALNLAARAPFGSPLPDHTRAPGKGAYGVACTMVDGTPIAITSDARGVRVWNLSTGTTLGEPQPKNSGRLVFSMG
ncbi:WD40 repeat domain-containing protein, partial [Streptomyces mirabilis]